MIRRVRVASGAYLANNWEADLAQGEIADRLAGTATDVADAIAGSTMTLEFLDESHDALVGGRRYHAWPVLRSPRSRRFRRRNYWPGRGQSSRLWSRPHRGPCVAPAGALPFTRVASVGDLEAIHGQFNKIQGRCLGSPIRYEGLLRSTRRTGLLWSAPSMAFRSGAGRFWFATGTDNLLGLDHSGPSTP